MSPYGHIDLRVRDMGEAQTFYDALLPALGFVERYPGEQWSVWVDPTLDLPMGMYFAVTESTEHVANENRIAFAVGSRLDVERIGRIVDASPKEMPYAPGYYAIFFSDPSGNPLEVYYRPE